MRKFLQVTKLNFLIVLFYFIYGPKYIQSINFTLNSYFFIFQYDADTWVPWLERPMIKVPNQGFLPNYQGYI